MLNTPPSLLNDLPPSPDCFPPFFEGVLQSGEGFGVRPPRRRGAQPLNRNALRHGLYSRVNPTPLTHFLINFQSTLPGLEGIPRLLETAILEVRLQIARIFSSPPPAKEFDRFISWHRSILHLMGCFIHLQKTLFRLQQPQRSLQLVAVHALALIRQDFHSNGITRDAYSFREKNKLSDFNSLPEYNLPPASSLLFLTPRQCRLLAPLLPPVNASPLQTGTSSGERLGLPSPDGALPSGDRAASLSAAKGGAGGLHPDMGVRLGRPPANPLPLVDVIFWKLAHHARWQDLPPASPPMLTCRRYYRRLFLSGRLLTQLSALFKDFLSTSGTDLPSLVSRGCFIVSSNRLVLQPDDEEKWQNRTALLFMQLSWQALRLLDTMHPVPAGAEFNTNQRR
jgi:hypothetical protein